MKTTLLIFLAAVVYKSTINFHRYQKIKSFENRYSNFLKDEAVQFLDCEPLILQLFKSAGLNDVHFAVAEPMACDLVASVTISHFANLSKRKSQIIQRTKQCFCQAACIFKQRSIEAFSPIYWIDAAIYLPRTVLSYLGLSAETIPAKGIQLIYWVIGPLLLLFRDQLYHCIFTLFG